MRDHRRVVLLDQCGVCVAAMAQEKDSQSLANTAARLKSVQASGDPVEELLSAHAHLVSRGSNGEPVQVQGEVDLAREFPQFFNGGSGQFHFYQSYKRTWDWVAVVQWFVARAESEGWPTEEFHYQRGRRTLFGGHKYEPATRRGGV